MQKYRPHSPPLGSILRAIVPAALAVAVGAAALAGVAGCAKTRIGVPREGMLPSLSQMPVVHRPASHALTAGAGRGDLLAHAGVMPSELGRIAPGELGRVASPETPLEQLLAEGDRPLMKNGLCPPDMASVDDLYCIDRFEGSLLEIGADGRERSFSATQTVDGHTVRAVSEPGVAPQAYLSGKQALEACGRSGKRLCKASEWRKACRGPENKKYGYGDQDEPKRCNDRGRAPLSVVHGMSGDAAFRDQYNWAKMNDPALNQVPGTVAKTGELEGCTNGYGVHDMVGNVHEWIDDPQGTFLGGFYLDTHINGDGCSYTSDAHAFWYHDYSTGFRCCADVAP